MNDRLKKTTIWGTVFIIVVGSLLHFVYEWSGESRFIAIFGAINESTWEHLKLLFWPALIFSIFEYLWVGNKYNNYLTARAISLYLGIFLIISMFYTYTGIFGNHFLVVDILIFVLSVVISQYVFYKIATADYSVSNTINIISLVAIILLMVAFMVFTINPPQIPLFQDPTSGEYGLK